MWHSLASSPSPLSRSFPSLLSLSHSLLLRMSLWFCLWSGFCCCPVWLTPWSSAAFCHSLCVYSTESLCVHVSVSVCATQSDNLFIVRHIFWLNPLMAKTTKRWQMALTFLYFAALSSSLSPCLPLTLSFFFFCNNFWVIFRLLFMARQSNNCKSSCSCCCFCILHKVEMKWNAYSFKVMNY